MKFAFRTVLARVPRANEQTILEKSFQRALDSAEVAAWATVAGTILRMDETITRP